MDCRFDIHDQGRQRDVRFCENDDVTYRQCTTGPPRDELHHGAGQHPADCLQARLQARPCVLRCPSAQVFRLCSSAFLSTGTKVQQYCRHWDSVKTLHQLNCFWHVACSQMTEEEVAASQASLESGGANNAAIMQLIAAFMCAGAGGNTSPGDSSAPDDAAEALVSMQQCNGCAAPTAAGEAGTASGSAQQRHQAPPGSDDEVAAVADALCRLSVGDTVQPNPEQQQPLRHINGGAGRSGGGSAAGSAADAVVTGQFDWAAGLLPAASAQRSAAESADQARRLPEGGSAAAAEALLSRQFQWGAGSSAQLQPIYAPEPEAQVDGAASFVGSSGFRAQWHFVLQVPAIPQRI